MRLPALPLTPYPFREANGSFCTRFKAPPFFISLWSFSTKFVSDKGPASCQCCSLHYCLLEMGQWCRLYTVEVFLKFIHLDHNELREIRSPVKSAALVNFVCHLILFWV